MARRWLPKIREQERGQEGSVENCDHAQIAEKSETGFRPGGNRKTRHPSAPLHPYSTTENRDRHKPDRCAGLSQSRFPGWSRHVLDCLAYHVGHVILTNHANPALGRTLRYRGLPFSP
jgi:hypothetical protein